MTTIDHINLEEVRDSVTRLGGHRTLHGREIIEYPGLYLGFILNRTFIEDMGLLRPMFKNFYDTHNKSDKSFMERYEQEESHYKMLWSILEHKENETKYYFNEGVYDSRKIVAHSSDCISTVQVMIRDDRLYLNVLMRSSDVKSLLPVDIFGLLKGCKNMFWAKWTSVHLAILIGSAHIYVDGTREHKLEGN